MSIASTLLPGAIIIIKQFVMAAYSSYLNLEDWSKWKIALAVGASAAVGAGVWYLGKRIFKKDKEKVRNIFVYQIFLLTCDNINFPKHKL